MKKIRENKGITLLALIVTIIVLLILAGISVSALTGDNSIIKQAGNAKNESENAKEREALELAVVKAMGKDQRGNIAEDKLRPELEGYNATIEKIGKRFIVTFNTSGKKYKIDQNGDIDEYNRKVFKEGETTSIYAKLYTDKTLILSSFNYTDPSRTVQTDYSNNKTWRSSDFTKIVIYDEIAPGSGYYMFNSCKALEEIENIENLHTENMNNMHGMFYNCQSLKSLDLSYFDTSKVTVMSWLARYCTSLETIDLSSFDTSNVTVMNSMFENCKALKELDLSSFDTSKVTNMANMFSSCEVCTRINLGNNFDTSSVTNMSCMFSSCKLLGEIDTSNFNTSNVTNMGSMFNACGMNIDGELKLNLKSFDTSKVTDMSLMFSGCSTIHTLDLSSFRTDALTSMARMFLKCSKLETLNFANAEFKSVTDMFQIFGGDDNLKEINFKNADFSNVTSYSLFFQNSAYGKKIPITITISSDSDLATAQKAFLDARRQDAGNSIPTYITE